MNIAPKQMLLSVALAAIGLVSMNHARADAFAQAVLVIDNFRLLHSGGTAFNATDFGLLDGNNSAHATAALNAVTATAVPQNIGILTGLTPDVAHQFVGLPNPPKLENNFTPFAAPPAVPGTFGYADQNLSGAIITVNGQAAGATAQTRADASLATNGAASGDSDVGTSTTFNFTLGQGDTMTFDFDARAFTQAYATGGLNMNTNAIARLSWTVNILNLTTGAVVFSFQPPELNSLGNVSRTDSFPGLSTYDSGNLAFSATTPMLNNFDTYQLTINHTTLANAVQSTDVPEPGSLAIFGLGLLGLSALYRRRGA